MKKIALTLMAVFCLNVFMPGTEAIAAVPQTGQTTATIPAQPVLTENADDFTYSESEDAAKKRRKKKKKKKNPVVKYIVGGAIAVAAIVLYVVTDGEGYHSR